jgi:hypothetical protein
MWRRVQAPDMKVLVKTQQQAASRRSACHSMPVCDGVLMREFQMIQRLHITLGLAAMLAAAPAFAQAPPSQPACAAVDDAGRSPALAGWISRSPLPAATDAAEVGEAALPIGKGVDALLKKTGEISFPIAPTKPGGLETYGGLYEIRIAEPGDYQVSLGAGAWIEMVSGKVLIDSTAHTPGAACSSLKKTVVFPLKPGRYVLEISGNGQPTLAVMVTRVVE